MNTANALTTLRIALSPLFLVFALLPIWFPGKFVMLSTVALWTLFVTSELTDMLDGAVARAQGIVSDLGKLLDPFADVVCRLTYFLVFVVTDIMPVWMFALIMYREVGIIFVRMMMARDGVALAARKGGKTKAVMYAISTGFGLLVLMNARMNNLSAISGWLSYVTLGAFALSVILAWASFCDYLVVLRNHYRNQK